MPRGRQAQGDHTLSNAQRQARYRARHRAGEPPVETPAAKPVKHRGRGRRWSDAVAELLALQREYSAWLDALPDSLRATATAEALEAIVDLDLDPLADIMPPRGFGRD